MYTGLFLSYLSAIAAFGVGVYALWHESKRCRAKYAYAAGMVLLGLESLLAGQAGRSGILPDILFWQQWCLPVIALLPGVWMYFSLTYARGNEGEFIGRWKAMLLAALVLPIGMVALGWNELLSGDAGEGPHAMRMLLMGNGGVLLHVMFTLGAIFCLMNLEATLKESKGTMRWRVKYMIVGIGLVFVVRCYSAIQAVLYSAVNVDLAGVNSGGLLIGSVFMFLALSRGTLSAVDLYPSPRALYGSLTVIVAGAYLLLVGLLAEVAARLEAGGSFPLQSLLVLAGMCGVAVALLSDRLRLRTKRFISLHFNRPQYDYRRVWTDFTERTASLSDPQEFCRVVTRLISETFEALSVTLWIVDEHGRAFFLGGSTSLSEGEAQGLLGDGQVGDNFMRELRSHTYPTAIRSVSGKLGDWLRQLGQKTFKEGGEYFFLPLTGRGEVVGLLIVGDRVGGMPFTGEEFDLMRTLGDQIVASLLRFRLSRRLGDARKLEAFQTMSAFFVHDLKNTASTLSLMLQNLPKHFDDPAFRQDALRAIGNSVDRINTLIGRLGYFRQKLDVKPVATDLNAMIATTVAGIGGCGPELVSLDPRPIPPVMVDPEQFSKVVTNMVLNARDALGVGGKIVIRTESDTGVVVLSVSDNGCGMTPEFMAQSLFRPFQTTKKEGIGIGLFHSKMIVEAHGGTIEGSSRLGEGSTFRVKLPVLGGKT